MKNICRGNVEKSGFKKTEKCAKNLIFCEFFRAIFYVILNFRSTTAIFYKKKSVMGAIQMNGPVKTPFRKNRLDRGYPVR